MRRASVKSVGTLALWIATVILLLFSAGGVSVIYEFIKDGTVEKNHALILTIFVGLCVAVTLYFLIVLIWR